MRVRKLSVRELCKNRGAIRDVRGRVVDSQGPVLRNFGTPFSVRGGSPLQHENLLGTISGSGVPGLMFGCRWTGSGKVSRKEIRGRKQTVRGLCRQVRGLCGLWGSRTVWSWGVAEGPWAPDYLRAREKQSAEEMQVLFALEWVRDHAVDHFGQAANIYLPMSPACSMMLRTSLGLLSVGRGCRGLPNKCVLSPRLGDTASK